MEDASTTGSMWAGVNNTNTNGRAVNALNMPMYPVNLSNYVAVNNTTCLFPYTSIYGAHYTLAVGDPFVVSSFAAKMLWHLATGNRYSLSNDSLSKSDLEAVLQILAPAGADGAFASGSTPSKYASWLFASPAAAGTALSGLQSAAANPVTHSSIWGKVLVQAFKLVTSILLPESTLLIGADNKGAGMVYGGQGAYTYVDGILGPVAGNWIRSVFTSATLSPPPPQDRDAPPVTNATYSSSNLLGMMLNSTILQAEINNQLGLGNRSGYALYSNYPIATDNLCSSVTVENNLVSGNCYTTDAFGHLTTGTVTTGDQDPGVQSFTNVLSTYANSQSDVRINLWDAILTGSEITTVQDHSQPNNGYMQLSNPGQPAFSPPTQVVDATGGGGASVYAVNTSFNSSTGFVAVASYVVTGTLAASTVTPPSGTPEIHLGAGVAPKAGLGIQFAVPTLTGGSSGLGSYSYDPSSGILTVNGYTGTYLVNGNPISDGYALANGPMTLDMTGCAEDSDVYLSLDADPTSLTPAGATGTLDCIRILPLAASSPAPPIQPTLRTLVGNYAGQGTEIYPPDDADMQAYGLVSYDPSTGSLTVQGYGYTNTQSGAGITPLKGAFYNGQQQLDVRDCSEGSEVTLAIYPIGTNGEQAFGYLTCQSPPALPYSACSEDIWASGGVVVAITQAPDAVGNGAEFKLGCACVPDYLGGSTTPNTLGGVAVGATSDDPTRTCPQ